jgi:hypothetical protein
MGIIADKASIKGVFGGMSNAKSGKIFISVMSAGPKIDKVCLVPGSVVEGSAVFGQMVSVDLHQAEQKFQDYNGSFSVAVAAKINVVTTK